jgi:hypothetical protein
VKRIPKKYRDMMKGYEQHEDGPIWAADPGIWKKAEESVDPTGKGSDYDDPWAVVAYVYERMGGSVKKDWTEEAREAAAEARRKTAEQKTKTGKTKKPVPKPAHPVPPPGKPVPNAHSKEPHGKEHGKKGGNPLAKASELAKGAAEVVGGKEVGKVAEGVAPEFEGGEGEKE